LGWQFSSKLFLIVLKIEVGEFLFQDYSSCNCPELRSNNILKDGKNFCSVAGTHGCSEQEDEAFSLQ
jgi:hypothetical protein